MKKTIMALVASAGLMLPAFSAPVQAQSEDLAKRAQAMQECQVEGWLGYGSYEVCVESVYYDLLHGYTPPGDGPEYHDPYGCSAESRMCPR